MIHKVKSPSTRGVGGLLKQKLLYHPVYQKYFFFSAFPNNQNFYKLKADTKVGFLTVALKNVQTIQFGSDRRTRIPEADRLPERRLCSDGGTADILEERRSNLIRLKMDPELGSI